MELISYLCSIQACDTYNISPEEKKIIDLIIHEMEKRDAKKINEKRLLSGSFFYVCPNCKITLDKEFQAYCDKCGQKLKWGKLTNIPFAK